MKRIKELKQFYSTFGHSLQTLEFDKECCHHSSKAFDKILSRAKFEKLYKTVARLKDLLVIMKDQIKHHNGVVEQLVRDSKAKQNKLLLLKRRYSDDDI